MSAITPSSEQDEVLAGIRDMYAGFVTNDQVRFDSHLDPENTTWESHFARMYTRAELDAFRAARTPAERPVLDQMRVEPRRVEVWGDTALAAYILVLVPAGGGPIGSMRVTDVLRRVDGEWRIVHHHAMTRDEPDDDLVL